MHIHFLLAATAVSACSSIATASDASTLVIRDNGIYDNSVYVACGPWTNLPGASWIWESDTYSLGPFSFVKRFTVAASVLSQATSAMLR